LSEATAHDIRAGRPGLRSELGLTGAGEAELAARAPGPTRREIRALDYIIALIYERSRIRMDRGKEALIRSRLGKRMRALGIPSLPDYCQHLDSPEGAGEITRAIDALTTNFTHFLREREHFEFMVNEVLPGLLVPRQKQFSIWSAACATGEEPYTIAFHLEERFPTSDGWNWRIQATDISTRALEKAVQGVYPDERLECLPRGWGSKYFQRGFGTCAGFYRVKRHLQERISFRQMNLLEDQHDDGAFEIIFCRNVMIYFDRSTQERLANRLGRALVPGGYLFTGRAESLNGLALPLRCLRPSIYQKPN
jgi:chemotaxis protein methyltransferase CheR